MRKGWIFYVLEFQVKQKARKLYQLVVDGSQTLCTFSEKKVCLGNLSISHTFYISSALIDTRGLCNSIESLCCVTVVLGTCYFL